MRPWFDVPVLEGSLVRLEPLAVRHAEDLAAAAEEDRGSYDFTLVPRGGEVAGYLAAQLARAARGLIPFAHLQRARELAQLIARQAPLGVQGTLANARAGRSHGPDAAREHLLSLLPGILHSQDAAEGVRSFTERRQGRFTGH